jgi:hypothetical protein
MGKSIVVFLATILILGCKEEKQEVKKSNPMDIVNNPLTADSATDLSSLGTLQFADTVFNFGKIKSGEIVTHTFVYKNTGNSPVLISDANTSCGCTVPEYKKEPIAVGEDGEIKIKFNSEGKHGMVSKSVYLKTNANPAIQGLIIQGEIID